MHKAAELGEDLSEWRARRWQDGETASPDPRGTDFILQMSDAIVDAGAYHSRKDF